MTKEEIRDYVEFIKNNCDEFLDKVYDQMKEEEWKWWKDGGYEVPTYSVIRKSFFILLDKLMTESNQMGIGGFMVFRNEDKHRIECYFGHKSNNKEGIEMIYPANGGDIEVIDFIYFLCSKNPVLDIEKLKNLYKQWREN